jgi:hypothetical protein
MTYVIIRRVKEQTSDTDHASAFSPLSASGSLVRSRPESQTSRLRREVSENFDFNLDAESLCFLFRFSLEGYSLISIASMEHRVILPYASRRLRKAFRTPQ